MLSIESLPIYQLDFIESLREALNSWEAVESGVKAEDLFNSLLLHDRHVNRIACG